MRIPPSFRDLFPLESVKQIAQTIGNPNIASAVKEAIERVGFKDSSGAQSIQQAFQNAGRWVESILDPWAKSSLEYRFAPGINATGEVFSSRWASPIVTSQTAALQASLVGGFVDANELQSDLKKALCERTGAADCMVVSNPVSAIWAIASASKSSEPNRTWILPRIDCIKIPRHGTHVPSSLRNLLDSVNVSVSEIGSNQECTEDDFQRALAGRAANVLMAVPNGMPTDQLKLHWQRARKSSNDDVISIHLALNATFYDIEGLACIGTRIQEHWDHGADLVVAPTDGLIGLPEGCLVLTKKVSPLWNALSQTAIDSGIEASCLMRLILLDHLQTIQTASDWQKTELGQVLTTSADNLRNRAQRLSIQLGGSPFVDRIVVPSRLCRIGSGIWSQQSLESAVLEIVPKKQSVSDFARHLEASSRPIWGNVTNDHFEVVLRTMHPDDDRILVQRLCEDPIASDERKESES